MATPAMATLEEMKKRLPEQVQNQVIIHLQEYLADLDDEIKWDTVFQSTQPKLASLAKRANKQIAEGQSALMDF